MTGGRSARRRGIPRSCERRVTVGSSVVCLLLACPPGDVDESARSSSAPAAPAATAPAPKQRERPKPPLAPPPWRIPVGPKLTIEPGQGLGPIRFGARLETVERLMGEPCEQKLEQPGGVLACRYSAQAAEFFLEGGEVTKMRVHRLGRPFQPESKLEFGILNGGFLEGGTVGMLMAPTQELLGKPKAVRKLEGDEANNPYGTVEVHEYDNFSLEYDRLGPDRVVLGGVTLTAPKARRGKAAK